MSGERLPEMNAPAARQRKTIKRVGVVVKPNQPDALKTLCRLIEWLASRGVALVGTETFDHREVEQATGCAIEMVAPEEFAAQVDLVVVLGGDGTMLATARLIGESEIPVIGVNYGTLGYLAEFRTDEMLGALERALAGEYKLDRRMALDVELYRAGEVVMRSRVLNDVVISKSALARIIEIEARCGEQFVNRFRADGLIISTPTGSTAYNLSAGGPILHPSMHALVVTPICPHTLSNRPLVVTDEAEIRLTLRTPREEVALTLDGQTGMPLEAGDCALVRKSRTTFNLVQADERNYFDVLRDKLHWGRLGSEK